MNLKDKIRGVLENVQFHKTSHQQKVKVLKQYYEKVPVEEFFQNIKDFLKVLFSKDFASHQNANAERILEFLANFVAEVTPSDDGLDEENPDVSLHPFLTMMVRETLKYHNIMNERFRYNSCLFLKLILQHIDNDKSLDNEVCNLIQDAMLERTLDPKSPVRLQAVMALIRLQDPINPECLIMKAYLSLIVDSNPQIRIQIVKFIAPNNITLLQIIKRLRDTDSNVRISAFRRCADLGPRNFKISERQHILNCGLSETEQKVKKVFSENLLPKWLNAYSNNYIIFLNGLKLDADENDITITENITKNVVKLLLKTIPIKDIVSTLPLTEEKVISQNELTSEAAALWNFVVGHLREIDTNEDYIEEILPNLTPFCDYIKSVVKERDTNKMEDWEFLDYQYILYNLFDIAEGYDLSDEVGRRTLHQFAVDVLKTENVQFKLKKKVVELAYKTSQKTDDFTTTMCHIISEIQETFVEKPIEYSENETVNQECQKAEIRVKIIRREADLEDALDNEEFLKADALNTEIIKLKENLQQLTVVASVEMVKVTKDDPKTMCDCLDLLIALLELPIVDTLTPSMETIKDVFVVPLLNSPIGDINWRVLNCLALFGCFEQKIAQEYIKVICIPIVTYRSVPNFNKNALIVSIKAVSDFFRIYGPSIFSNEEAAKETNQSLSTTANTRRLYRSDDLDNILLSDKFQLEILVEIILDMLDDEMPELRDIALEVIGKLILGKFPVSPLLVTRLILKWYNPLTAKSSGKLQQLIGVILGNFVRTNPEAKEIMAKAVIPILQSIASAPLTSPLADVDVDNLLLFLSSLTGSDDKTDLGTHLNMAHTFVHEILKTKNSLMVKHLSKMLLHLELSRENATVLKELIAKVDSILENEITLDKSSNKNLRKFREKINIISENQTTNLEITDISQTNASKRVGDENRKDDETISNRENRSNQLSSIIEENEICVEKEIEENTSKNQPEANKTIPTEMTGGQSDNIISETDLSNGNAADVSNEVIATNEKNKRKKLGKTKKKISTILETSTTDEDDQQVSKVFKGNGIMVPNVLASSDGTDVISASSNVDEIVDLRKRKRNNGSVGESNSDSERGRMAVKRITRSRASPKPSVFIMGEKENTHKQKNNSGRKKKIDTSKTRLKKLQICIPNEVFNTQWDDSNGSKSGKTVGSKSSSTGSRSSKKNGKIESSKLSESDPTSQVSETCSSSSIKIILTSQRLPNSEKRKRPQRNAKKRN